MVEKQKKLFYANKSASRKNGIMNWYLENDNRPETIKSLVHYLKYNDIGEFENVLESDSRSTFSYIVEEGQSENFANRIIRKLNITKNTEIQGESRQEEIIKYEPEHIRKYGTVKGKRVKIDKYTPRRIKRGDKTYIYFTPRDKQGRIVKAEK